MFILFSMFYGASLMYTWMTLTKIDNNLDKFKAELGEWWWVGLMVASPAILGKKVIKFILSKFQYPE